MTEKSLINPRFRSIEDNLKEIRDEIAEAAEKTNRQLSDITLMAVTKTVDASLINYAIDNCEIKVIGENRVQEFLSKESELHLDSVDTHLIGHLQTNKVSTIIPKVKLIHSLDSIHLANAISKESVKQNLTTNVLIEVNIGKEESKTGFYYENALEACHEISEMPNIKINGLMAIPPMDSNNVEINTFFSNMYKLFIDIRGKKIDNINMSVLSMGMSGDYIPAILSGSNLVRIGSKIFGARVY